MREGDVSSLSGFAELAGSVAECWCFSFNSDVVRSLHICSIPCKHAATGEDFVRMTSLRASGINVLLVLVYFMKSAGLQNEKRKKSQRRLVKHVTRRTTSPPAWRLKSHKSFSLPWGRNDHVISASARSHSCCHQDRQRRTAHRRRRTRRRRGFVVGPAGSRSG